jgi:hypothetical protein
MKHKKMMSNLVELDLSFNLFERQEDLIACQNFRHLNLLVIIGNPLVLQATSTLSPTRKLRPRLSMKNKLERETEPVTMESIQELERLLYVNNRTLLLWKPPVIQDDQYIKPINISKFSPPPSRMR